jgi:hypothetical protein
MEFDGEARAGTCHSATMCRIASWW